MTATTRGTRDDLLDVGGLRVGHHTALGPDVTVGTADAPGTGAATGCTVVLAPDGAVASVDVRGGGPGTRETDLLAPAHSVQRAHAILLTGGSAYGLAAADGVMTWLEERGHGISFAPGAVVPIVPGAVVFDLPVGAWHARPTAESGYLAAQHASSSALEVGCVGAGTGARAGALKGGIGSASVVLADGPAAGVTVGALVVANPVGSVVDPRTGVPWGVTGDDPSEYGLRPPNAADLATFAALGPKGGVLNTTIGVVATDAVLGKDACNRMAVAAHDGLARAVRPAHSPMDGDTFFALATGLGRDASDAATPAEFPADLAVRAAVCEAAAVAVRRAVAKAVLAATPVAGIPTYREVFPSALP
ncbi:P1 family peptidase [Rhodococcus sp. HNM0569]|uniref:P1 family peptidase n=1 Tax=Rhodococcus sp. HNM0569 TaxID=2716340 RepID=UPI00146E42C8|nr:P1 family peptidase [Rhodococcus sp. HNM0569]